jgi:hypothetical protein
VAKPINSTAVSLFTYEPQRNKVSLYFKIMTRGKSLSYGVILGSLTLVSMGIALTFLVLGRKHFTDVPSKYPALHSWGNILLLISLILWLLGVLIETVRRLIAVFTHNKFSGHFGFLGLTLGILLFVFFLIPSLIITRGVSASGRCINNLRQIDAAKQMWGMEHHKTGEDIPTETDLIPYLSRRNTTNPDLPHCPLGGAYQINALKGPPTCSFTLTLTNPPPGHWVTNHVLPY